MTPEKLLTELKAYDKEKYKIVTTIRDYILKSNKSASEEVKYGGLLYSDKKPYTGLFVSKNHVYMEFTDGFAFSDPNKLLQGTGKYRRHLKIKSTEDINEKEIARFLKQAEKLLSRNSPQINHL